MTTAECSAKIAIQVWGVDLLGKRRIFISYRRADAPAEARNVCGRLERAFGKGRVFMDVDNLSAGQRFDQELDKALSQCDVLIAVIGRQWTKLLSEHTRKSERDYVHDEIAAALKRNIIVIPVLVGLQGRMPSLPNKDALPNDIRDLVEYQKHEIMHENFNRDADGLTTAITTARKSRRSAPWLRIAIFCLVAVTLFLVVVGKF